MIEQVWALPVEVKLIAVAIALWALYAGLGWLLSKVTGWRVRLVVIGLWLVSLTPIVVVEMRLSSVEQSLSAATLLPTRLDVTGGLTHIVGGNGAATAIDAIPELIAYADPAAVVLQMGSRALSTPNPISEDRRSEVLTTPARFERLDVFHIYPVEDNPGWLGPIIERELASRAMRLARPDRVLILDDGARLTRMMPDQFGLTPEIAAQVDVAVYVVEDAALTVRILFAIRPLSSVLLHGDVFVPHSAQAVATWQSALCGYNRAMVFDIYCPVSFLSLVVEG
ncbi:MAG: hypothetical protein AAGF88_07210 [Pseudomonadota bacterium]